MGDGSFGFTAGELETIVRLRVPIMMVVISNSSYGWIKAGQKTGFGERYFSVDFSRTDHARVAEAFGVKAWQGGKAGRPQTRARCRRRTRRPGAGGRHRAAAARGARAGERMGRLGRSTPCPRSSSIPSGATRASAAATPPTGRRRAPGPSPQLDEASNRIAQGLKSLGIGAGDRVACLTKHTADCVALVLGANKIGAVCMPVNWRLAPPEIEYIVENGQAKLLMADAAFRR